MFAPLRKTILDKLPKSINKPSATLTTHLSIPSVMSRKGSEVGHTEGGAGGRAGVVRNGVGDGDGGDADLVAFLVREENERMRWP